MFWHDRRMAPKNTEHFANIVRDAVMQLGLTQSDVASRGGPSDTTLRRILAGDPVGVSSTTLRKLDAALGWRAGSAAQALHGGQPVPCAVELTRPVSPLESLDGSTEEWEPVQSPEELAVAQRQIALAREALDRGDSSVALDTLVGVRSVVELAIRKLAADVGG
ncbi:helix-turn-helix domain-containing protein [Gordonia sp. N1V]|uniref:helix-turn-helix domain-containing protein n=1 Tax=Gordonia sp. N1V TaxID=3034163 RepID=UPI0023E14D60|nr:helix-turn-helix domain-containing protein [Gordonia sp. N1V]MDF3284988.1 helix-turn-helix domain-containing protein [Gordonia sp. N1V]